MVLTGDQLDLAIRMTAPHVIRNRDAGYAVADDHHVLDRAVN